VDRRLVQSFSFLGSFLCWHFRRRTHLEGLTAFVDGQGESGDGESGDRRDVPQFLAARVPSLRPDTSGPLDSRGWLSPQGHLGPPRESRFLHCAVAFAPAPVGMTRTFAAGGSSRPPNLIQHALAQDAVGAGLVSLAGLLQPGDYVGIEAHGDGLFHGTIEPSPHGILPRGGREFREPSRAHPANIAHGGQPV